jgi:hypothetical protein
MEGFTLAELAEALEISQKTVEMRLFRAGIKPLMRGAIYDKSALETIRNVPGKGRPKKISPKK